MEYIADSESISGYKVKIMHREDIKLKGFTLIIPHHSDHMVAEFWDALMADGRLEKLRGASAVKPWVLGLGSWDPECDRQGGFRYSICIEETEHTNFSALEKEYSVYSMVISETDWMCFETEENSFQERFWKDDPYKMMRPLGYVFNTRGENTGVHFDAYPPEFDPRTNPNMEFWITVRRKKG